MTSSSTPNETTTSLFSLAGMSRDDSTFLSTAADTKKIKNSDFLKNPTLISEFDFNTNTSDANFENHVYKIISFDKKLQNPKISDGLITKIVYKENNKLIFIAQIENFEESDEIIYYCSAKKDFDYEIFKDIVSVESENLQNYVLMMKIKKYGMIKLEKDEDFSSENKFCIFEIPESMLSGIDYIEIPKCNLDSNLYEIKCNFFSDKDNKQSDNSEENKNKNNNDEEEKDILFYIKNINSQHEINSSLKSELINYINKI